MSAHQAVFPIMTSTCARRVQGGYYAWLRVRRPPAPLPTLVEALLADPAPPRILDYPGVELVLPQHRHQLALRIVVDARRVDQDRLSQSWCLLDTFHQPATLPKMNKLPVLRQLGRCYHWPSPEDRFVVKFLMKGQRLSVRT